MSALVQSPATGPNAITLRHPRWIPGSTIPIAAVPEATQEQPAVERESELEGKAPVLPRVTTHVVYFRLRTGGTWRSVQVPITECAIDNVRFRIEMALDMHPFFTLNAGAVGLATPRERDAVLARRPTAVNEFIEIRYDGSGEAPTSESEFVADGTRFVVRRLPMPDHLMPFIPPLYRPSLADSLALTSADSAPPEAKASIEEPVRPQLRCMRCQRVGHLAARCPHVQDKGAWRNAAERHPTSSEATGPCRWCGADHCADDCAQRPHRTTTNQPRRMPLSAAGIPRNLLRPATETDDPNRVYHDRERGGQWVYRE